MCLWKLGLWQLDWFFLAVSLLQLVVGLTLHFFYPKLQPFHCSHQRQYNIIEVQDEILKQEEIVKKEEIIEVEENSEENSEETQETQEKENKDVGN
jgi:hypothetical protein